MLYYPRDYLLYFLKLKRFSFFFFSLHFINLYYTRDTEGGNLFWDKFDEYISVYREIQYM